MRRSRLRLLGLAFIALVYLVTSFPGAGAGTAAARGVPARVVVVLEAGGCPRGDTLYLCEGLVAASRRTGVPVRIVTPTFRENLADFLGLVARQGYAAVVTFGLNYTPELGSVARAHPGTRFIAMDTSWTEVRGRPRNVQGVVFQTSEAAYLAGWLAAKLEQRRPGRDVVGVVGGVKIPSVEDFVLGFAAGARRAAPRIKVLVDYSDDFGDPDRCAALARRQIARGAGTVFNVAGECGLGTLAAAAEAKVWAVGVDSDQSVFGRHVLTSVLKRFDAGFLAVLRQVKAGRVVTGRDMVLKTRDGAVGLGRISPGVPRSLVRQLEDLRRRIIAGTIVVPGAFTPRRTG